MLVAEVICIQLCTFDAVSEINRDRLTNQEA